MCGRYLVTTGAAELERRLGCRFTVRLTSRYNVAPTQPVPVVLGHEGTDGATRVGTLMRWGLVPSWASDVSLGSGWINARCETVAEKPAFRHAFRRRRCLLPADGFYEWQAVPGRRTKQPWRVTLADESVLAFAGVWETWCDAHGNELDTCAVLTCGPNELMSTIHDRMPVILPPEAWGAWLHTDETQVEALHRWLVPYPADEMLAVPVSGYVSDARHEGPRCAEPVTVDQQRGLFG